MASKLSLDQVFERINTVKNNLAYQTNKSAQRQIKLIHEQLALYPPLLPGQKYVRTLTLKRGWEQGTKPLIVNAGFIGPVRISVTNPAAPYWLYVQDERYQAKVHRGRWKTIQQIVKGFLPILIKTVDSDLQGYIDLIMER